MNIWTRSSTEYLLGGVLSPNFDAFGCPARGAHLDDKELAGCFPCAVERGDVDQSRVALDDERGVVKPLATGGDKLWPHTRHFKPGVGLHREDGPAIDSERLRAWFVNGVAHRVGGPALEWGDGHVAYFANGKLHRVDGPAVEDEEGWQWRLHGLLHRDDGPARYIDDSTVQAYFVSAADRYRFALDDQRLSRDQVWARWVADQTDIDVDNTEALAFLDAMINGSKPQYEPFGLIDEATARLVLVMHGNIIRNAPTPPPDIPADQGEVGVVADADASSVVPKPYWSALSPDHLLPLSTVRKPLAYNGPEFRRRIGEAERLGTLTSAVRPLNDAWPLGEANHRWEIGGDYVSADLEIDADLIAFGLDRYSSRSLCDERRIQETLDRDAKLSIASSRYLLAKSAHDSARKLVAVAQGSGSVSSIRGRLAPDPSITDPIERAFEFAAQAISAGVDSIVARSWATALVVAAGYPAVPLRWMGNGTAPDNYERIFPTPSIAADYYSRAIDDLQTRHDATRFLDYVSRCFRWPSSAALTDG